MKRDPEKLEALCKDLCEQLDVPCVVLITLKPGEGTGFSVNVPDYMALEVPPVLWMLGNHFAQVLGVAPEDYMYEAEEDPATEDIRKH